MSVALPTGKSTGTPSGRRLARKRGVPASQASGVVNFCVAGSKARPDRFSSETLIQELEKGLPFSELEALRDTLGISMELLARRVGISRPTLHRRKGLGRLTSDESDRLVRFARLMGMAVHALGSADHAREWLAAPQYGLGGAIPLDYARTEIGAREVEDLLGRIEHGVYS